MSIKRVDSDKRKKNHRYDNTSRKWIAYKIDVWAGKTRFRETFATKTEAERFVAELQSRSKYRKAGFASPNSSKLRISALFERRLKMIDRRKERINSETAFRRFSEVVGFDILVTEIRKAHFQEYINSRLASVSPATIRREMTRIAGAINDAEKMFPIDLEGFEAPKIVRPKVKRTHSARRIITETEMNGIVSSILNSRLPNEQQTRTKARPIIAAMFELGWLLGLRYSEILGIEKKNFNETEGSLLFVRQKTQTLTRMEFLPEQAIKVLKQTAAASDSDLIFNLQCSGQTVLLVLKAAIEDNGISYGRRKLDGVTFHSTRHSFTTRLVQVTDIATAAAFTGHSDKEMVAHYSHATSASKKAAMTALYGTNEKRLRDIFERIVSGDMKLEEFQNIFG